MGNDNLNLALSILIQINKENLLILDVYVTALVVFVCKTTHQYIDVLNTLLEKSKISEKSCELFIASISHELRNPLHDILMNIEMLVDSGTKAFT